MTSIRAARLAASLAPLAALSLLAGCGGGHVDLATHVADPTASDSPPSASPSPTPRPSSRPTSYDATTMPDGARVRLTGTSGQDGVVRAGQMRLEVRLHGRRLSAPVPAGWGPELRTRPLRDATRPGQEGYITSQEGGDSDTWTVFTVVHGRLVAATPQPGPKLGGGFAHHGHVAYGSYQTDGGRGLYTTVGISAGRAHLYRWHLAGARLVRTDLGVVCFDPRATAASHHSC